MFRKVLISIIASLAAVAVHAEETRFRGQVIMAGTDEPAVAFIVVESETGRTLAYTSSGADGRYELIFDAEDVNVVLKVSGMGLKAVSKLVKNESGVHDFRLEEAKFVLKEAKIRAVKMEQKEDTVAYNVESFRSKEDRVIEDVLKKLPGITVLESGKILYKDRPIEALTIDGMDLLKGRYGIATKNISPEHIATVEILENHQAVKALKDLVPSDKTYLNLKLKASSRGVFILSAGAGGGYDGRGLWNAEVAPMYFGHSQQHIFTAKTNNTGNDLSLELESFTADKSVLNPTLTSATMASAPAIEKDRYYFNTSHAASANDLFRTSKGDDITVNVSYINDRETRDAWSETSWMLPDSTVNTITEDIANNIALHKVDAEVGYLSNRKTLYLRNSNSFSGTFSDMGSLVSGISQNMDRDVFKAASSVFAVIRNNERNAVNLNARVAYEHTPYSFRTDGGIYAGAVQNVSSDGLQASLFLENVISTRWKGINFSPNMSVVWNMNGLESELTGVDVPDAVNDMTLNRLHVTPSVNATYSNSRLNVSLYVPVSYCLTALDNSFRNKVFVQPELQVRYRPTASMNLDFDYSFRWTNPQITRLYEGAILSNYRTLSRYDMLNFNCQCNTGESQS